MARIGRMTLLAAASVLLAAPALADGVLEIDGATADGAASQSLEVASWSFGASSSSGAPPTATGRQAAAPAPKVGDEVTVAVRYRTASTRPATGAAQNAGRVAGDCVKGQHIKEATLKIDGRAYVLSDLVVTECDASAAAKGDPLKGMLKGHVTLIK